MRISCFNLHLFHIVITLNIESEDKGATIVAAFDNLIGNNKEIFEKLKVINPELDNKYQQYLNIEDRISGQSISMTKSQLTLINNLLDCIETAIRYLTDKCTKDNNKTNSAEENKGNGDDFTKLSKDVHGIRQLVEQSQSLSVGS